MQKKVISSSSSSSFIFSFSLFPILFLFLLLPSHIQAGLPPGHWLLTCGNATDRVFDCNGLPYEEVHFGTYHISDCHFIGCPIMVFYDGFMTVDNVTFEGANGYSGGVFQLNQMQANFTNVRFLDCSAWNGGVMYIHASQVNMMDAYFENSAAGNFGGSIYTESVSTFSCTNCEFVGSKGGNGGALNFAYSYSTLTNVTFKSGTAVNGAGISFIGGTLTITNAHFFNGTAANWGGGIQGEKSALTCTNCSYLSNFADVGSGLFLDTVDLTWIGGYLRNQKAGRWGAGMYIFATPAGVMTGIDFANLNTNYGPAFFINGQTHLTLTDFTLTNASAAVQAALAYMYTDNVLTCIRCHISNLKSADIGGLAVVQDNSQLILKDSWISDITSANQGAIYLSDRGSTSTIINTTLENLGATSGSAVSLLKTCSFSCINSTIRNGLSAIKGCINIEADATVTLDNCYMDECHTDGNGGALFNNGHLMIQGNTMIINAEANLNGGALFATGSSDTTIQDTTQILNASALGCGGSIYSDSSAQVIFKGNEWKVDPFLPDPSSRSTGQFLCIKQTDVALIQFNNVPPNETIDASGNVWIEDVTASQDFIKLGLAELFPPTTPIYGGPSRLVWATKPVIPARGLRPGETIPKFSVQVLDRWYHIAPIAYQQIVVVRVSSPNQALSGETERASLDFNTSIIDFPNVAFVNASPGVYPLYITPLSGTLKTEVNDTFPTIEITIALCDTDELFSASNGGRCLPTKSINQQTRIVFVACGASLLAIALFCSFGVYFYRELQLVKGSAPLFLVIMNAGVMIMAVALIAGIDVGNNGCIIRSWFENIGFLTIFVPLLLKTKRIQFIFQNDWAAKKKHANRLTTLYLLRNLGLCAFVAVALMIIWTVLDQPDIDKPTFFNDYVVTGRCRRTQGDLVAIFIRIGVLLYAVELALSVRNAPSNFNESKVIGFTTYNWAVFTGIGSSVAAFAIDDPEVAFIIYSLAIFVPCLVHTLTMTGYKIFLCFLDPDAANVRSSGYSVGGHESGSRLQLSREEGRSPTKEPQSGFFTEGGTGGGGGGGGSRTEKGAPESRNGPREIEFGSKNGPREVELESSATHQSVSP